MNQWPNGQSNGMFPQATQGHLNPASLYNNVGNGGHFDINQFTQGLSNGNTGTPTPNFQNQTFQPGSVVPAKRTHDGMSGSPVQGQGQGQGSRSQTPSYGGFQNQQSGGQQFPNAPTPYAHLQQAGSNNATPSPTMQNQQFRPPTQQRMRNASSSPFPHQQADYGNQISPAPSQNQNLPTSMPQQGQMAGLNQQYGMNANAGMAGVRSAMQGQMNNMGGMNSIEAQKAYQMRLQQHQQQMRAKGMIPPRVAGAQQNHAYSAQPAVGGQMSNGQAGGQMDPATQQHLKRMSFLKTIQSHAAAQGRPFNPTPNINGKPVDLLVLSTFVIQRGGSMRVEQTGEWPQIATAMGFTGPQYTNAPDELKHLHMTNLAQYERLWFASQQKHKQEQARVNAQQMAGVAGPTQGSPPRTVQMPGPQNQYSQMQQSQQAQAQPQATPVQASAQLPQNGMTTPQQQMMQHRRNSSVRKQEQVTPQPGGQALTTISPQSAGKTQRSPPTRQGMKEGQSSNYSPEVRVLDTDGGYNVPNLDALCYAISRNMPTAPAVDEMGIIDTKAIGLSLASGIHAEVRYALDALANISFDTRIQFDLNKCEDLIDTIIDCAEDQIELLSEEAAEVSDALDLAPYEEVLRASKVEADTLQDVPAFGSQAWDLDRAAEKLIAITTIFRNFSFYEHNHRLLTSTSLVKWLSNTIRLLGTRNMLLRTFYNTQDFYKDMVTFLSNTTQSLELPSRDDALHILHFLLAFAPQPAPSYTESGGKIRFTSFVPTVHRYLPPAVDCLAKLLARQDPNRMFYRSIFTASSSSLAISESPLDLLTRAFALSISVLPNRSKGPHSNSAQLRMVEARKAYVSQGMLAADILTSLAPGNETDLARAWLESEDGWVVGLLSLAGLLSVDRTQGPQNPENRKIGSDFETFRSITQRALTMMKRLAEKAGRGRSGAANGFAKEEAEVGRWEGIPQDHAILGALGLPSMDNVALRLLCGLHEMAMQA